MGKDVDYFVLTTSTSNIILLEVEYVPQSTVNIGPVGFCMHDHFLQANLSNANLEGALATGNTSFKGSNITGAGM